jgi:hypothetical protein
MSASKNLIKEVTFVKEYCVAIKKKKEWAGLSDVTLIA